MNREFWKARADWPRDQDEYIFLGRATERVGQKLFGVAVWDAELEAFDSVLANPVPDIPELQDHPQARAHNALGLILARHRVGRTNEANARNAEARKRLDRILDP